MDSYINSYPKVPLTKMTQGGYYSCDKYGYIHVISEYNIFMKNVNYPDIPSRPINSQTHYLKK